MTADPERQSLRDHLVQSHLAGQVRTPRENNLDHFRRMSAREPLYLLGLEPTGTWSPADVLALMVDRCGVSPDPAHTHGVDTIDPERTLERLDTLADVVRDAAHSRARVLVATGHPYGLMPVHAALSRALRNLGCTLLEAAIGWVHPDEPYYRDPHRSIGYRNGVAVLLDPVGSPVHTHSPLPMRAILDDLDVWPDLVIADHGWAGAAGQAGITTVGFADCNDPALFVGEDEGSIRVCVPLDDNLDPALYEPIATYLLRRIGGLLAGSPDA